MPQHPSGIPVPEEYYLNDKEKPYVTGYSNGCVATASRLSKQLSTKIQELSEEILTDTTFGDAFTRVELVQKLRKFIPPEPYADEPGW